MEIKPISVDRKVYREFCIQKVIPAIKNDRVTEEHPFYIQKNDARPHFCDKDSLVLNDWSEEEWNITLRNEPAN